ncbi:MAG: phosphoribosylglycinamide formyltransferase [Nitrososphaerota archaeon]|nr:phosphoribosylglycinamide formyltransferase [Nitrososphaerota archaeon]
MKIVILASGRGTDFQAISDHVKLGILRNVSIAGLITNHECALVMKRASETGVPQVFVQGVSGLHFSDVQSKEAARKEFDNRCVIEIKKLGADIVVLAGFDQIVSPTFVDAFRFKILNIHPAYDLSRFGGKNMVGIKVHEQVLKAGVSYSGCTIHFVTNDLDGGPVLLKKSVHVDQCETPASLEAKILQLEHLAYPEAIQLVADGRVKIDESGRRCYIDQFSDGWDIEWDMRQMKYIEKLSKES